ncbi:hypothetical protein HDU77_000077 [Chytriomyces hyalinus]|nr:hypothetical protein HDU77_000077 [Chytriomyces hyalinus]
MGAQSSKAVRRMQPRVLPTDASAVAPSGAASAAATARAQPTIENSNVSTPTTANLAQPAPEDSRSAHEAVTANFHQLNWSIKTTKSMADFKPDNEMLSILSSRKAAARGLNPSFNQIPTGKFSMNELEDYFWARKAVPESKRAEFDASAPLAQRISPENLAILRVFFNTPEVSGDGSSGGVGGTQLNKARKNINKPSMFDADDTRRQSLKQERQNEMQMFLAKQAQVNPRLRKLRAYQPDVVVSIADPMISSDASRLETGRPYDQMPPFPPYDNRPALQHSKRQNQPTWLSDQPSTQRYGPPHFQQNYQPYPPIAYPASPPPAHASRPWDPNPFAHGQYPNQYDRQGGGSGGGGGGLQFSDDSWNRKQQMNGSRQYANDLRQQMMDDRSRKEYERGDFRGTGRPSNSYQGQPGGLVGQEQPYFGGDAGSRRQQQQQYQEEAPHFGRRMAQQIHATNDKEHYLQELNEQVRFKKEREQFEKSRIRAEDMKKQKEMDEYDPWGKAGGGAPHKKADGSISTNLRNYRHDPNESPNSVMPQPGNYNPYMPQTQYPNQNLNQNPSFGMNPNLMSPQSNMAFLANLQQGFGTPYGMLGNAAAQPQAASVLGGYGNQMGAPPQNPYQAPGQEAPKSFLRGHVSADQIPDWQKAEMAQKHRAQLEIQDALKKQVQEREAKKAKEEALKKEEELKEQERVVKEQELLRQKYARELEEQRRKEAEMQAENEKKLAEKIAKAKEDEARRDEQSRALEGKRNSQDSTQQRRNDGHQQQYNNDPQPDPIPFRSTSPPIPTLRAKGQQKKINQDQAGPDSVPQTNHFRSDSPPLPAQQHKRGIKTADGGQTTRDVKLMFDGENVRHEEQIKQQQQQQRLREKSTARVETSAVLQQLLSIQRELENEDMKIKKDLSVPFHVASRKKENKGKSVLDEILAAHQNELDEETNTRLNKSKFYIPSVLEQQKEILAQQDREIKALREEGKRSQSRMATAFQDRDGQLPEEPATRRNRQNESIQPKTESNFKTFKYLKNAEDFFGTEKHKLEFLSDKLRSDTRMLYPDNSIRDVDATAVFSLQSLGSSLQSSRSNSALARHGRRSGKPGSAGSLNLRGIEALNDERLPTRRNTMKGVVSVESTEVLSEALKWKMGAAPTDEEMNSDFVSFGGMTDDE